MEGWKEEKERGEPILKSREGGDKNRKQRLVVVVVVVAVLARISS